MEIDRTIGIPIAVISLFVFGACAWAFWGTKDAATDAVNQAGQEIVQESN